MEYTFQKIPTNQIHAGGVALAENSRKELQHIVRVAAKSGLLRPVLILDVGNELPPIQATAGF